MFPSGIGHARSLLWLLALICGGAMAAFDEATAAPPPEALASSTAVVEDVGNCDEAGDLPTAREVTGSGDEATLVLKRQADPCESRRGRRFAGRMACISETGTGGPPRQRANRPLCLLYCVWLV